MNARPLAEIERFSDEKLQKNSLFQTERMFVDLYCLRPGQAQKIHAHEGADKVYVVLEGRCRFAVGPEERELGPGHAVLARSGEPHGVVNAGAENARLLVFMSPPPKHG